MQVVVGSASFGRLVLGCFDAKFSVQILLFEAFLKIYRNSFTLCLIFSSFQIVSFFRIVWMIFSKIQHKLNVAIFQLTQQLSQILTKCLLVLLFFA